MEMQRQLLKQDVECASSRRFHKMDLIFFIDILALLVLLSAWLQGRSLGQLSRRHRLRSLDNVSEQVCSSLTVYRRDARLRALPPHLRQRVPISH